MRITSLLLCLSMLLLATPCSGEALPITTISGDVPPTTAPVQPVSVMLLPFHAVTPGPEHSWISAAIDEDLAHELSRNRAIRLVRPAATQPAADGLAVARDANADRLISGSYQVVDDQLRINAELITVNQAQPVGEVKATGHVRDLFQLEDSLATQLWHVLPHPSEPTSVSDIQVTPLEDYAASATAPAPEVYQSPQSQVSPGPLYNYSPDYDYAPSVSPYPYDYGYGYPYGFGVPLFFFGDNGHHENHDHGEVHGHDGGGGHTPAVGHGPAPSGGIRGGGAQVGGGGHR